MVGMCNPAAPEQLPTRHDGAARTRANHSEPALGTKFRNRSTKLPRQGRHKLLVPSMHDVIYDMTDRTTSGPRKSLEIFASFSSAEGLVFRRIVRGSKPAEGTSRGAFNRPNGRTLGRIRLISVVSCESPAACPQPSQSLCSYLNYTPCCFHPVQLESWRRTNGSRCLIEHIRSKVRYYAYLPLI